ncbi:nucleotidyltransferase family protein [Methanocella conradii]|uniref:nucleotidyltransferase family protein n=1 Tax=Methanocella conradii TaxID=1175444 RepID=UPI0024B3AB4C|nr:nucleotidyltransferase family protein [Methanocella conradii]MDI6895765.1 nucleotidyltransferase family protein [Methanocella conradii]
MKSLEEIRSILEKHKEEIREKYGVVILGIFGSFARGEEREDSDIDILIELESPIGLKFFELWDELEKLLGYEVDLVRKKFLREEIREEILKEVVPL